MKANVFIVEMSACLPNQSIALKNGVGDIAAMAKSSFVHTPKIKDIIWDGDYDIL